MSPLLWAFLIFFKKRKIKTTKYWKKVAHYLFRNRPNKQIKEMIFFFSVFAKDIIFFSHLWNLEVSLFGSEFLAQSHASSARLSLFPSYNHRQTQCVMPIHNTITDYCDHMKSVGAIKVKLEITKEFSN